MSLLQKTHSLAPKLASVINKATIGIRGNKSSIKEYGSSLLCQLKQTILKIINIEYTT